MSTTHDVTTTDTLRDPGLAPAKDTSGWLTLRLLRTYMSWAGPAFNPGEVASFHPNEARVMVAIGAARRADEPDPALMPEPEPVIVRVVRGFSAPDSGASYGAGERVRLPGRIASTLIQAGTVVPDDGVDTPPTAQDARLLRAKQRREAREGR